MAENLYNNKGQSKVELEANKARLVQAAKSDYNSGKEYTPGIDDLMQNGGKGTGNGPKPDNVPNLGETAVRYQFDTSAGGNEYDRKARSIMTNRSLYGPKNEYHKPDTRLNVEAGQYDTDVAATRSRIKYVMPTF